LWLWRDLRIRVTRLRRRRPRRLCRGCRRRGLARRVHRRVAYENAFRVFSRSAAGAM
jgi:hypothetical protein